MRRGSRIIKALVACSVAVPLVAVGHAARVAAAPPTFSTNVNIGQGAAGIADTEPSIRVARDGTVYVGAIKGVPSGADFWRSDNNGASFTYLGSPDSVVPQTGPLSACCLALGGGDEDFAVDSAGNVGWSSLTLASVTVGRSTNKGALFVTQPLGSVIPGVDREWNESDGATFYMSFHDSATNNIDIVRSPAAAVGGLVYTYAGSVFPFTNVPNNELGNLVADRRTTGHLYQPFVTGPSGSPKNTVAIAMTTDGGSNWTHRTIFTGPAGSDYGSTFPVGAVDGAGNVYEVVTDESNGVLVFRSTDAGTTWTGPVNVSSITSSTVFPWIAAGGNGGVVVGWLGASSNTASSTWNVYAAESTNATAASPSYTTYQVNDAGSTVRTGIMCTQGLACGDGRQLGDFFQVAVGHDGTANVAWADTRSGGGASVYYARGGVNLGTPND